jgi:putative FmdB family regulatory protein
MPIYEYVCKKCRHRFETIVHGSSKAACPSCGTSRLEKQLSVFAVGGGSGGKAEGDLPEPCRSCGDARGPGACSLN